MPAKILLSNLFLMLVFSSSSFACGVYELNGVVRDDKSGYRIVTAEGSQSQTVFKVPAIEAPKLFPYENATVKVSVVLEKEIDGTRAQIARIEQVALRVPDPMKGSLDSNFKLKEKRACAK
jgi:hypothetical protein